MSTLDLEGKVVAVFDDSGSTDLAVAGLKTKGHSAEVLSGESGRRRLDEAEEGEGILDSLKEAATTFLGDEDRVLDKVDRHLAQDRDFVVVEADESTQGEIADILKEHGGHFLWYFGNWTYVSLGDDVPGA